MNSYTMVDGRKRIMKGRKKLKEKKIVVFEFMLFGVYE